MTGEYHRNNDNMEYFYQLEIWKGNIDAVLRVARQRDELTDWLVAMAPMASFDTWTSVCEDYALQLEADGQYHKAASYFLACHKIYEAIRLFKRHKLFKEAIALAKVRLSPLDPALEELYTLWAQQLTKDGNYEQAAKCHLAMKQVQDAAKLLARRYDQSSLKTAARISMIANDKQQGLMYTQRTVQQHLLQHEWKEVYTFLRSQTDVQIFLATSSIHEILTSELSKLDMLSVDTDKFSSWGQQALHKTHLPEFILDPGDVDSLSPWQPIQINGHTFPHHVMRIWYGHLDIAMDTTSLENMYKTLCLLHAGRQTQVDLQQVLIQVCTDLTLFLLSLMMSETPTAMSHLLHAVGCLHEAGHLHIMEGVLRLFLPQGPKYILKLQQEVTAMRVMISMDSHAHVDGASKVHTLKRYLSDLKDDSAISTSNLRCRELDCLRAYYYVAILNFLKESCSNGEHTNLGICIKINHQNSENAGQTVESGDEDKGTSETNVKEVSADKGTSETNVKEVSAESTDEKTEIVDEVNKGSPVSEESVVKDVHKVTEGGASDDTNKGENLQPDVPETKDNSQDSVKEEDIRDSGVTQNQSKPVQLHSKPLLNINHYSLTLTQLCLLSQGVLWDLQAKRFALTETLGYIHKAISHLLLSKNSSKSPDPLEAEIGETEVLAETNNPDNKLSEKVDSSKDTVKTVPENSEKKEADTEVQGHSELEGAISMATDCKCTASGGQSPRQSGSDIHVCEHHGSHMDGHICHTVLSHHFEHMMNIHVPHLGDVHVNHMESSHTEMTSSLFDICSSCELLQKSRKILFEDEPFIHARQDSGIKDMTNITNPAKYINVPDEWYSMPVDQKYFKPYVTMATLKEEQEYVMHELKRGPDSTQAPFPNPLASVKCLLTVVQHSSHISAVERKEFVQKVITWALNFAVTTQQKQTYVNLLQSHLES